MRNKKIIFIVTGFLFSAFFVFLLYKFFTVKQIVIIGNKHLPDSQIRSILGIREGNSILYNSSKNIYDRLKKSPWIKEAKIRKDLNGKLTIFIQESTPTAILQHTSKYYLVSNDGEVLEDFTDKIKESKIFLPVIKELDPFKDKKTLIDALNLIIFVKTKNYVNPEDEIIITGSTSENLTLNINGFPIIVGTGDYERKFSKYMIVVTESQKRGLSLEYVDLRFPDKVIVKPRQ